MAFPHRLPNVEGPSPTVHFDYFGKIPASVWRRRDVSNGGKIVLGGLAILSRGRSCWVRATQAELADACGVSVKTVRSAIVELVKLSIVSWESIGSNFTLLFRLKGQEASCEPLLSLPEGEGFTPSMGKDLPHGRGRIYPMAASPPITPLMDNPEKTDQPDGSVGSISRLEPKTETVPSDDEYHADLLARANSILGGGVVISDVLRGIGKHGDIAIEWAIDKAESQSGSKYSWGWIMTVAGGYRPGELPKRLMPKAPSRDDLGYRERLATRFVPTDADIAESIERAGSPDPIISSLAKTGILNDIKAGLVEAEKFPEQYRPQPQPALASAQEKSAGGRVGKHPPQPIGVTGPRSSSVHVKSTLANVECTNEPSTGRWHCARKDSNLQPSDSESVGRTYLHEPVETGHLAESRQSSLSEVISPRTMPHRHRRVAPIRHPRAKNPQISNPRVFARTNPTLATLPTRSNVNRR
jgi:hypothetical protein